MDAGGGENLEGGDSPEVSPVVSVVSPGHAGVVVADVLSGQELGAVGENDVVLGQAFFGGRRGRNKDGVARAQLKENNGAVAG